MVNPKNPLKCLRYLLRNSRQSFAHRESVIVRVLVSVFTILTILVGETTVIVLHASTVRSCLHLWMRGWTDKPFTTWNPALLVYDYALTFGHEVELFWRRGPLVSRVLIFCCRSLVVMYVTTTVIATYISPLYTTVNPSAAHWHEALIERLHIPGK